MDGLTAISLAANILQFLEFSTRLLSDASEVYHSASGGLTREYVDVRDVAVDLKKVVDELGPTAANSNAGGSLAVSGIAQAARAVAEELIEITSKIAGDGKSGKKTRWRSFRQALASLWSREKIEGLVKRLESLRGQLCTQMLAHVGKLQSTLVTDLGSLRNSYEGLNAARKDDIRELLRLLHDVQTQVQHVNADNLRRIDSIIIQAKLNVQTYGKEKQILESLLFDTMTHRYHAIPEAHQRTFHWIFEPSAYSQADPRARVHFKEWLVSGHGMYWVSGKPGSGKSTLMKYICDAPQTKEFLQQWAGSDRLVTAGFYFWAAGTEMQRCQRGLLQQLLFEIVRACPDLIPVLCTERWQHTSLSDWTLTELRAAFAKLEGNIPNTRICFFIDGLDEYEGDELELIDTLQHLAESPQIKLCVSSRPWPCFEDTFGTERKRKLYLHRLTVNDIRCFARDKLEETPGFNVDDEEQQAYTDLLYEITRRAHGVFLWVFLLVRSLREGITIGDSLIMLRKRLDEMPSDLEPFFDNLLKSVDSVYLEQMATTFEVAIRAPEPLSMLTYWFLDEENAPISPGPNDGVSPGFPEIRALEDQMHRRLQGRYKGLLQPIGVPGSRKVHFIHRTVRDYLRVRAVRHMFAKPNLCASMEAFRALLRHAKYCSGNQISRGFNTVAV